MQHASGGLRHSDLTRGAREALFRDEGDHTDAVNRMDADDTQRQPRAQANCEFLCDSRAVGDSAIRESEERFRSILGTPRWGSRSSTTSSTSRKSTTGRPLAEVLSAEFGSDRAAAMVSLFAACSKPERRSPCTGGPARPAVVIRGVSCRLGIRRVEYDHGRVGIW